MQPQLLREIGEALAVLVQDRRLAQLAPDQKLVEDAGQIRRTGRRVGHRFPPFEKTEWSPLFLFEYKKEQPNQPTTHSCALTRRSNASTSDQSRSHSTRSLAG